MIYKHTHTHTHRQTVSLNLETLVPLANTRTKELSLLQCVLRVAVSHLKYVLEREQTPPELFAFGVHQFVCKIITIIILIRRREEENEYNKK